MTIIESVPFWLDVPEPWNELRLQDITLPGVSTVRITRKQTISREKGNGTTGETLKFQGSKLADVIITVRVHTAEQLAELVEVLPELEPTTAKQAAVPFDIFHPKATLRGVKSIVIESIAGPDPVGNGGVYELTIQAIEYKKPEPKPVSTAKGGNGPLTHCQALAKQLAVAQKLMSTAATAEEMTAANLLLTDVAIQMQAAGCGETPPSAEIDAAGP